MLFLTRFYLFDQLGWLRCIRLDNHDPCETVTLGESPSLVSGRVFKGNLYPEDGIPYMPPHGTADHFHNCITENIIYPPRISSMALLRMMMTNDR